mmetsp:Transcript_116410/g.301735  ORF Transcript_116410/g.301735 Transcript_116410/m.301735 type:complete len:245 (-) Transcript_116410:176-910(-)
MRVPLGLHAGLCAHHPTGLRPRWHQRRQRPLVGRLGDLAVAQRSRLHLAGHRARLLRRQALAGLGRRRVPLDDCACAQRAFRQLQGYDIHRVVRQAGRSLVACSQRCCTHHPPLAPLYNRTSALGLADRAPPGSEAEGQLKGVGDGSASCIAFQVGFGPAREFPLAEGGGCDAAIETRNSSPRGRPSSCGAVCLRKAPWRQWLYICLMCCGRAQGDRSADIVPLDSEMGNADGLDSKSCWIPLQ